MDYIHGTTAERLRELKDCDIGLYGTPDQDRNFKKQMADIQAELSSFKFDQIGSLYQDENTSEFFIGPEVETGKGRSMDYFNDLATHELQVGRAAAALDVQKKYLVCNPGYLQTSHLIGWPR